MELKIKTSALIYSSDSTELARITPDGVMEFKVDATDENARRFIDCIDNVLAQMGRGGIQSIKANQIG